MKWWTIFLLSILPLYSFHSQPLLEVTFSISEGAPGDEIVLKAGLDSTATDSLDEQLGEYELPPLPPYGSFDVRIILTGTNGILNDYRHVGYNDPSIITEEYSVLAQLSSATNELSINYDITNAMEFSVIDQIGTPLSELKKSGTGTIKIPGNRNNFKIRVKYQNPLVVTSLSDNQYGKPEGFYLLQNYPNPFNSSTIIHYNLSSTSIVCLKIYDALGQLVNTLIDNEIQSRGMHKVSFNASSLSSGVYFYQITDDNSSFTKKMQLLK